MKIETEDKILTITKDDDYLESPAKFTPLDRRSLNLMGQAKVKEYEKQIDQMVYKIYGLTEDEIKIVEGGTTG